MTSEVKVYDRGNGELQRVQVVRLNDWSELEFLNLEQETVEQQVKALGCFCDIYSNYLVPAFPWIFPQMVMFALPEDDEMYDVLVACAKAGMKVEEHVCYASETYGDVTDPLTIATIILQEGLKLKKGNPVFRSKEAEVLYCELEKRGCVRIICGKFPQTKIIPVGRTTGYMSQVETTAKLKANAHFFIMDPFDCATVYDQIGMPFGLSVKDGVVENPPLHQREALLIEQEGASYISRKDIGELIVGINGKTYIPGKNGTIYTRPKYAKTPEDNKTKVVIIGRRVVAVKHSGSVPVPAAGFVLSIGNGKILPGDEVAYHGLKDVKFGIQVGNSIIRKGVKTDKFISKFYNIYHLERIPYPPCLFPMDFENARAARMAIGADSDGKPVLFWAEGAGKLGYEPGVDSKGATLVDMAEIAEDLGLRNAVNLDGGGSAQILLEGKRALRISDRNKADNSDAERLVPLGLIIR